MTSPVTDPQQKRTQSAFCLMFLFCGMAFVDLAHLRKEDIKEGILSYYRQKSGSLIQVEIPAEAQGLLNELAADTTEDSPYLFPFLEGMKTGEDAYKEYNTVGNYIPVYTSLSIIITNSHKLIGIEFVRNKERR